MLFISSFTPLWSEKIPYNFNSLKFVEVPFMVHGMIYLDVGSVDT